MNVNLESLHRILKHPIRRRIVLALLEKQELNYMDLMNLVGVENTGKLNYHLKILSDLIMKNENGKYYLTEKGHLAAQLLLKFPEKTFKPMPLHGGDAILIGVVGFILALSNPGFWSLPLLGIGVGFLGLVYAFLAPGGMMWFLTVRRTNSHDVYDLLKPPLITSALFALLLVIIILLDIRLSFTFSDIKYVVFLPLPAFIVVGMIFPFLGVGISEIIYRTKIL